MPRQSATSTSQSTTKRPAKRRATAAKTTKKRSSTKASSSTTPAKQPAKRASAVQSPAKAQPTSTPKSAPLASRLSPAQPASTPRRWNKKVWWGVGAAGVVVLGLVIAGAMMLWQAPSRADYRAAYELMQSSDTADTEQSWNLAQTGDPARALHKQLQQAERSISQLRSTRAMRDGDVQAAYNYYKAAYDQAKTHEAELRAAGQADKIYREGCTITVTAQSPSRSPEEVGRKFDETYKRCTAVIGELKGWRHFYIARFATRYDDYLKKRRAYLVQRATERASGQMNTAAQPPELPFSTPTARPGDAVRQLSYDARKKFHEDGQALRQLLRAKSLGQPAALGERV
ncbi:hypothetical protein HG437_003475 [Candidatus Saccharibacteria bacterium]|nr:hypothetical protein [Candidatus Saccharibacteria bacterium]